MADFDKLNATISCVQVAQALGLKLNEKHPGQYRTKCPVCDDNGQGLSIHQTKGFQCWPSKGEASGRAVNLVMHLRGCSNVEAGRWLNDQFIKEPPRPSKTVQEQRNEGFKALTYLDPDHDAVGILGFDAEIARKLGIGYAPKGVLRGKVAIPVRLPNGELFGYIGIDDCVLPASFRGANITELKTA